MSVLMYDGARQSRDAEQRRTLISMRQAGVAVNRVALQMNISRRTVSRVWQSCMRLAVVLRRPNMDAQRPHSEKTGCYQLPGGGFVGSLCTVVARNEMMVF